MISPNQSKDLFNLEQLRQDPSYKDLRQYILMVSKDLTDEQSPHRYAVNKLLNLLDGA